jgi:FkbM family methyltransferase
VSDIRIWSLDEVKEVIFAHEHRQVEHFRDIITKINTVVPCMVELGAAEGLYSVLFDEYFNEQNKKHINVCVELCDHKVNELYKNIPTAKTYHGYLGDLDMNDGDVLNIINSDKHKTSEEIINDIKKYTLTDIFEQSHIDYINILHVDIQGAETAVLEEISQKNIANRIEYFFISTHFLTDKETHTACQAFFDALPNVNIILNDPNPFNGSGYGDGLLIVHNLNFITD